jgi:hypothetical protein
VQSLLPTLIELQAQAAKQPSPNRIRDYTIRFVDEFANEWLAANPERRPAPPPGATPTASVGPTNGTADPLDNDAIVAMIAGGLKDDTIIRTIDARPSRFRLAPDSVLALKAAGASQAVIAAMSAKMSAQR